MKAKNEAETNISIYYCRSVYSTFQLKHFLGVLSTKQQAECLLLQHCIAIFSLKTPLAGF